jgi:hypothetical protein
MVENMNQQKEHAKKQEEYKNEECGEKRGTEN